MIFGRNQIVVPDSDLIPGDIVQIKAGKKVPASPRLIEVVCLKGDEPALTGNPIRWQDGKDY